MAEAAPRSVRDAVRWGLLLAAVAVSGFRLPSTYGAFRDWHAVRFSDPSAAELYRLTFTANAVAIVIVLAVAVAVFYLLRPRISKQP
jgi:heme/copper-type cytochrome/quinol oxidase subunit 2